MVPVLDSVEEQLNSKTERKRSPRRAVLVLRSMRLALNSNSHPRPPTVLGSLSGQYLVRIESKRAICSMTASRAVATLKSCTIWVARDRVTKMPGSSLKPPATPASLTKHSTPGGVYITRRHRVTQREATARGIMMRGLKDFPYQVCLLWAEKSRSSGLTVWGSLTRWVCIHSCGRKSAR